MMPFISRYRLSNSTPLGFGLVASTGVFTPFTSFGWKLKKDLNYTIYCNPH
jgi:hypothetical protein